jgi:hypothetical protein
VRKFTFLILASKTSIFLETGGQETCTTLESPKVSGKLFRHLSTFFASGLPEHAILAFENPSIPDLRLKLLLTRSLTYFWHILY